MIVERGPQERLLGGKLALCAATERSSVPINANAMPTEQSNRYFHIASIDAGWPSVRIRSALMSVVASRQTQSRPKLFEQSTAISTAKKPFQIMPKRRARLGPKCPLSISSEK